MYNVLRKKIVFLSKNNPRDAAEHSYALAMLYKRDGNYHQAIHFGKKSITLFNKCRMETLEECAAINVVINGIAIPDLIHQEVVRNRLQPFQLK